MSNVSKRRFRLHVLSSATAVAISSMCAMHAVAADRIDLSGLQAADQKSFDRFIVKYRDDSAERSSTASLDTALRSATRAVPAKAGRALGVTQLRRLAVGADVVRSDRKLDRVEAESLMRQLASNPNVEYVEVDKLNRPLLTPNDTRYSEQWGYQDSDAGIRANEAWDITNGAGSVVAVLDTGITSHSDLNANILPGYDFIGDTFVAVDGNGRDADASDPGDWNNATECDSPTSDYPAKNSSWHGTHVAGTIAAVTNNAKGVAGVAYGAKIVPARVLGKCGGYDSDIADAIVWASGGSVSGVPANANPAEVINLSLGGSGSCGSTTQNAINGAVSRGTTLVIAAGNSNANVSNASPANCNNVIAVASITSTGARSSFSNYGALIDVAAPGSSILSTVNDGATSPTTETYKVYNGTSMATPHVAGIVALIQAHATTPKTPAQIETLLKSTARAFPVTPSQTIGAGIADAKAAVDATNSTPPSGTQTYSNGTDYPIGDNTTVNSPIAVSGRTGNGPSAASINVNIVHTYKGDLKVDLVAPDGTLYNIHNRTGGSADNVSGTFTKNLTSEALNGTWNLRVNDNAAGDTGYINSWTITF